MYSYSGTTPQKEIKSMFQTGPLAYDLQNGGTMGKPMGPATSGWWNSFFDVPIMSEGEAISSLTVAVFQPIRVSQFR